MHKAVFIWVSGKKFICSDVVFVNIEFYYDTVVAVLRKAYVLAE